MKLFTAFLTCVLILAACAAPPTPNPGVNDSNDKSAEVILDGTLQTSLFVTEWRGGSEGNMLFPLDPATGDALPDYAPIPLGQTPFHAFSPDRRTLAVVTFPNQTAYHGGLMLIDLLAWKTQSFELELAGWVSTMVFSPDGKQLAIAHGESRFRITLVEVEQGMIGAQSQTDAIVTRLRFTEDGRALMLYSPTIDPKDTWKAAPPQIRLLDAADLGERWSAALTDVHDGIYPKDETVTAANIYEPGQAFYLSPGLVFAPDRDALYVVHADSEQLTTVDFESQTVKTVEIQPKLSWFEQLLSLTAKPVQAKIGDGITRQAVVSPDGRFLYVVGANSSTFQDQQGNWQMERSPLGLQILSTNDGSRVEYIEADTTDISLSPDGRFLYLRNWGDDEKYVPWTEIFDTSNQKMVARQDKVFAIPALLMNGEFLLTSTYSTGEMVHHMSILQPDGSSVLAEWIDTDYIYWLTTP